MEVVGIKLPYDHSVDNPFVKYYCVGHLMLIAKGIKVKEDFLL